MKQNPTFRLLVTFCTLSVLILVVDDAPAQVAGFALQFDGSTSYVSVPSTPSLTTFGNEITIEAWIKLHSYGLGGEIIASGNENIYALGIKADGKIGATMVEVNPQINHEFISNSAVPPPSGLYEYRLEQADLDGTATFSESVAIDVTAPSKFSLNQNYPNPFNPSTRISFSITKDGPVSLLVYDILGRVVATLIDEYRKAGEYTEQYNGGQMASGIYIYILRSSEGQLMRRMMILK